MRRLRSRQGLIALTAAAVAALVAGIVVGGGGRGRGRRSRQQRCGPARFVPGADMVWISGPASDQQAAYVGLLRAVQRGQVSRRRLDEALYRVPVAKRQYGLIR